LLVAFKIQNDSVSEVDLEDRLTGERLVVATSAVVNAAGPWVDAVLAATGPALKQLIGGTKGSHVVVRPFAGAPSCALYTEAGMDQRPFFIIPWNEHYLIGTTDLRFEGDLDHVEIGSAEVDYLLTETNRIIPAAKLEPASILFSYSGVRPLPFTNSRNEASITRRHFVSEHPLLKNFVSIVGGKLSTYRSLAEHAVDLLVKRLGKSFTRSRTAATHLPGSGETLPEVNWLSQKTREHLRRVYGGRAAQVIEMAQTNRSLSKVFDEETGAIAAEVVFAFQEEMARTLTDCLMRRTVVGLNSSVGKNAVEAAAAIAGAQLGWSEDRKSLEVAAYRRYIQRFQSANSRNHETH
jgi:glycerol-3-phosphate dehydrogenase